MSTVDPSLVGLAASVHAEEEQLRLEFVLDNRLDEGIYFYAHAGGLDRTELPDHPAYVSLLDDESILHISLLPPPPGETDYLVAVRSLSRYLPGGETYRAGLTFDLPLQPWTPYPEGLDEDEEEFLRSWLETVTEGYEAVEEAPSPELPSVVEATTVRFDTGWFPESGLAWREDGPEPHTYWCGGSFFRKAVVEVMPSQPIAVRIRRPGKEE